MESFFSILVRKALTPRDFPSVAALRERIHRLEGYYNLGAGPLHWQFSRPYLARLARHDARYAEIEAALAERREQRTLLLTC